MHKLEQVHLDSLKKAIEDGRIKLEDLSVELQKLLKNE